MLLHTRHLPCIFRTTYNPRTMERRMLKHVRSRTLPVQQSLVGLPGKLMQEKRRISLQACAWSSTAGSSTREILIRYRNDIVKPRCTNGGARSGTFTFSLGGLLLVPFVDDSLAVEPVLSQT